MALARIAARLSNKTVFITGASSGIGRSTALEFARTAPDHNLKLVLAARRVDLLDALAKDIVGETNGRVSVQTVRLDVSAAAGDVKTTVEKVVNDFGPIDVLVNNAGLVKGVARSPDISSDDVATMLATNVSGLIAVTQAVLPSMLSRNSGLGQGDIVNIGSIAGRDGYAGGSVYCATKAAVRAYTDSLRKELIHTRLRVIEIDPGQVETEFSLVRYDGDVQKAKQVYQGVDPLSPDDIAEIIVFACTRPENVVMADTLVFPSHQASATVVHRRSE